MLAVVAAMALGAPGCAAGTSTEPQAATSEETTMTASCTKSGAYRIVFSVNGSTPLLPLSPQGEAFTPRVGLAGTKAKAPTPTADLSMAADAPDPAPVFFNGLQLGSEASHNGYTIKITSICDGEVLFDVVKQPG